MSQTGLYRSRQKNIIAGVMGGIAERFEWNANVLRVLFVLVSVMSAAFPGILVYLILWMIMPKRQKELMDTSFSSNQPIRTVYEQQPRP